MHIKQSEEICVFQNFNQWVNHASWITHGYDKKIQKAICIDSEGYFLECGADFMESRDKKRFPVYVYAVNLSRITR